MSHSTAKVNKSSFCKEQDVLSVGECVSVYLRLDVSLALSVLLQPLNLDLTVEVTDVADDGVVLHLEKVFADEDILASSGGDDNIASTDGVIDGCDLVTLHGGLKGVDGINLRDDNSASEPTEGLGGSLTDISVSGDESDLTGQHNVGGTLNTVNKRLPASVQVVELGLGDRVVDVDGGHLQLTGLEHLVKVVDTSCGLLRAPLDPW